MRRPLVHAEHAAWITGEKSSNRTDLHWAVGGTDLGVCWDDGRGGVLVAFGDTFHPRQPQGGGGGGDWRSNVVARSTDRDLTGGMVLDSFVTDRPGHARELLPSVKVDHAEVTTIPTGGICVDKRQYMTYMSVKHWGDPGRWTTGYAGFAYSDDGGNTWAKPVGPGTPTWVNTPNYDQRFQMCALARHEGYVLIFGTMNGRAGPCYLARVPEAHVLDLSRHELWDGTRWRAGNPGADQWATAEVLPAPVSELSVMYHRASGQWLAAYFRESAGAVVVHTAPVPTGPWSEPNVVATAADFPGLYGAFWHPWSIDDPEPYFLMSEWGPYNVELMRLRGLMAPRRLNGGYAVRLPATRSA